MSYFSPNTTIIFYFYINKEEGNTMVQSPSQHLEEV